MITKNIFLYHLDYELHKLFNIHSTYSYQHIYNSFNLITRLAYLLCTESVIIPASNYFESDIAFSIVNALAPLNEYGVIKLSSSSITLEELLDKKEIQHISINSNPHYHYRDFKDNRREQPLYLPGTLIARTRSASKDIKEAWCNSIGSDNNWSNLLSMRSTGITVKEFENRLYSIPEQLDSRAFISEYVVPFLPIMEERIKRADKLINIFITQNYIKSFLLEYDAMCFSNIPVIDSKLILPHQIMDNRFIPYNRYVEKLRSKVIKGLSGTDYINTCSAVELVIFKQSKLWNEIITQIEYDISTSSKKETFFLLPQNSTNNKGARKMITTLVITALQLELNSILENFKYPYQISHEIKKNRHYYLISPNPETSIVCTAILGMGQVNAAAAIKDALEYKHFDRIILAGICGGISEKLNMGDIIISEKIVDYEMAKVQDDKTIIRWNVYNSDYSIINDMKNFSSSTWFEQVANIYPPENKPNIYFGTVLSGNKVMANRTAANNLSSVWDKSLAIEMEASGIAQILYQTPNAPPFIMVKSVCDLADKNKNDDWQSMAAKTAAVYVLDFIMSQNSSYSPIVQDKQVFSDEKNILFVLKDTYNKAELNELCFNIGIDIEDIGGQAKSEIAVELVKYCKRRRMLNKLISQINLDRDNILHDIAKSV